MTDILQGAALVLVTLLQLWQNRTNRKLRRDVNVLLEATAHLLKTKGNP